MSNQIELEYQIQVSKDVNHRDCNGCEFFMIHEGNPQCTFASQEFTDCRLVAIELSIPT